jgi:hypothetical protein
MFQQDAAGVLSARRRFRRTTEIAIISQLSE